MARKLAGKHALRHRRPRPGSMAQVVGELHEGLVPGLGLRSFGHRAEEPLDSPRDGLPRENRLVGALLLHLDVILPVVDFHLVLFRGVRPVRQPVKALDEHDLPVGVRQPRHRRVRPRWCGAGIQLPLAHVAFLLEPCHTVDLLQSERLPCPRSLVRACLEEGQAARLDARDLPRRELAGRAAAHAHGVVDDERLARSVHRDLLGQRQVALLPHRACEFEGLAFEVQGQVVLDGEVLMDGRVDGEGRRPTPILLGAGPEDGPVHLVQVRSYKEDVVAVEGE
mmetsp:Transcript_49358/g.97637  ORF Transcript_49358/g.97637 Transcript_49358/m.97637 type:complete len:281 (+) Transcript_49358:108-950(+)